MEPKKRVLVLDASAFIMGLDPLSLDGSAYTTPQVVEEIRDATFKSRCSVASEQSKLKVLTPPHHLVELARGASASTGDLPKLSEADLSVLALAVQLKQENQLPTLVTDDYSMQNVAEHLGIPHTSLSTLGIRARRRWVVRCASCGKTYPPDHTLGACTVCGGPLKRKPDKRRRRAGPRKI